MIDLEWLVWNVFLGLAEVGLFAGLIYAIVHRVGGYDIPKGVQVAAWSFGMFIVLVALLFNNFPFNAAYHSFKDVSGKVATIDSRLVGTGDQSTETKYVITFGGSKQPYGLTDTRGAGIKVGDTIKLKCERVWQYASVGGYDCRYNSETI